jgi:uncharacterized membrane protein YhaH (DUF805 family)
MEEATAASVDRFARTQKYRCVMSGAARHPGIQFFGFDDGKTRAATGIDALLREETSRYAGSLTCGGALMTDSSKPASAPDDSIGKRPAKPPELSEQVILFHGRYGRRKFWLLSLALPVLLILILPVLVTMSDPKGGGGALALLIMSLPFFWLYCKLLAHRLHDLGRSGWWSLAFLGLSIVLFKATDVISKPTNFFVFLVCLAVFFGGFIVVGCLRGTAGPNEYGPDPLGERKPEPEG